MNLEKIKSSIESMSKDHHIEILKIMKKNQNVKINENKSGVYINLSFLPEETLEEVSNYIGYINAQEMSLQSMESIKEEFKTKFFIEKEDKE